MSEAEEDETGLVDYKKFAPKAAELTYRLLDSAAQKERAAAVERTLSGSSGATVHGLTDQQVETVLTEALFKEDPQGTGTLPRTTVKRVLEGCSMNLAPKEVAALMSALDVDSNDYVLYPPLMSYAFNILHMLQIPA